MFLRYVPFSEFLFTKPAHIHVKNYFGYGLSQIDKRVSGTISCSTLTGRKSREDQSTGFTNR